MAPPGYANGNGHADPHGAEQVALTRAVASAVAKIEAAERSFNLTAKTLVKDGKELRGEFDELKGSVMRVEGKLDRLVEVVGRPPEPIDPVEVIRRMQTQSVQGLTADQVIAREERVRAELEQRAKGTGLFELAHQGAVIDKLTMEKIQEVVAAKTESAVAESKVAAKSERGVTIIKGVAAAVVTIIVGFFGAVAANADGIVKIVNALQDDPAPVTAPAKPEAPEVSP